MVKIFAYIKAETNLTVVGAGAELGHFRDVFCNVMTVTVFSYSLQCTTFTTLHNTVCFRKSRGVMNNNVGQSRRTGGR